MARRREVTCPEGHAWETRANPRVRLRCPECQAYVLAPPIEDPWRPSWASAEASAEGPAEGNGAAAAPGTPLPGGARVSRAQKTVSRARRTSPRPAQRPAERPDADLTEAQRAGRRGGLSSALRARMGR